MEVGKDLAIGVGFVGVRYRHRELDAVDSAAITIVELRCDGVVGAKRGHGVQQVN